MKDKRLSEKIEEVSFSGGVTLLEKATEGKEEKEKVFIERVISINRVTKVTKGGKNLGFSALVVVGDQNSCIGYGLGKANDVSAAIRKGIKKARENLIEIKKKETTIPYQVKGKFGAIEVLFRPAGRGTGVIASSSVRAVCECAGIKDILTKILKKSTNAINVIKATFSALESLKD